MILSFCAGFTDRKNKSWPLPLPRLIEQCAAAQCIKRFGLGDALEYLVGEKLLRFVEAAEDNPLFAQELPSFIAEIKLVFSVDQVGNYALRIERTKRFSVPQRGGSARSHRYTGKSIRLGWGESVAAALPCSTVWYLLGTRATDR
jgi:hypothetical protein